MNKQEFEALAQSLYDKGYGKWEQSLYHEDYVIGKGFHKNDNKWEEDRYAMQILLSVYDDTLPHPWRNRLSEKDRQRVGITIHIYVSRIIDEAIRMEIPWKDSFTIKEVEQLAENFYQWSCIQWSNPSFHTND